ncbi:ATP-grasp domain-containing protein [Pseudomonas yangonensis]|uniref:ATP-grasp domain-containing protein n=1 Tax=Pseudomonas yangonensis TaxID=2579922 RepID=UPI00137B2212|nr:ATP-grasp domain-containing protein [Pseudomonas yangonensis]
MAVTVLVTAIGSMSAECVLRSLSSYKGIRLLGSDLHPADWLVTSPLVQKVYQLPSARDAQEYLDAILTVCRQELVTHLIPLTDPEVDVISSSRKRFLDLGVVVCLPPSSCVEICRDKLALHNRFVNDDIIQPIPSRALVQWQELRCDFPFLAKPRDGRSSEGLMRLDNKQDLEYLLWRDRDQRYIVQPFYAGIVHVVDVLRNTSTGTVSIICRKELIRTSNGAGLSVAIHSCPVLSAHAEWLADQLDVHGCICMEFLECSGSYLLMDINPRFSAGVKFSNMTGYDMVLNTLRCFLGEEVDQPVFYPDMVVARGHYEQIMSYETR